MTLPIVSPMNAKRLIDRGALLVDIREAHEHAREHVPGARHAPLSRLGLVESGDARAVIFHCRSGARTAANAKRLAAAADCDAYALEGGIEAWKRAGLPVHTERSQPNDLMRQVLIAAGSLTVLGVTLGVLVAPASLALSAVVGASLVFGGATGWCGMAKLLALMPWNRRSAGAGA